MIELLTNYNITSVIIILFAVAFAIKEILELWDYFKNRAKKALVQDEDKYAILDGKIDKINTNIESILEIQAKMKEQIEEQQGQIKLLTDSDKDQLRSHIVQEYHYFCEQKGWIDDFSLDSLEKCFKHYKDEGGNSYIHDLMAEIRRLPHSYVKK